MWLSKAYLEYRDPVLVNVNWFMLWKDHPKQNDVSNPILNTKYTQFQIARAARVIRFACEYKQMLEKEQVEIEKTRNYPLCMEQLKKLIGVTRIPIEKCDKLIVPPLNSLNSVIVLVENQIYSIQVIVDNEIASIADIEK